MPSLQSSKRKYNVLQRDASTHKSGPCYVAKGSFCPQVRGTLCCKELSLPTSHWYIMLQSDVSAYKLGACNVAKGAHFSSSVFMETWAFFKNWASLIGHSGSHGGTSNCILNVEEKGKLFQ